MFGPVQTTYSFRDLTGVLINPILDIPYQLVGGNIGLGSITIKMLTERADVLVGTDGSVMPMYIAGANAEMTIEVQQTSDLHHALIDLYNLLVTAADWNNDVSFWAATTISLRTITDGTGHYLTGVMPRKIPDKPYAAKGQNVTWNFLAANAITQ